MEFYFYVLIAYWVISFFFFMAPYKKRKAIFKHPLYYKFLNYQAIMHCAHRGGARDNLENTIQAFDFAVKEGTNCLELDVCMTKDKKIVVIHDSNLIRMCGLEANVEDFNYNELPQFQEKIQLDFAVNKFMDSTKCTTKYLPLFEDVLKNYPNTLLNVEIKTPKPEVNFLVNELILKYKREKSVIWGNKYQKGNDLVKQANPNIPRFFCQERIIKLYIWYMLGLLPFIDIEEDSFQVPLYTQELYQWKMDSATSIYQKFQVEIFYKMIWFLNFISRPLFHHLSKRGVFVVLWVLNNEKEFERGYKLGAHGIMTDNNLPLKKFLQSKQMFIRD